MAEKVLEYERPWMYKKQEDAIFTKTRYSIIDASTKSGKTVGCMAWIFEQAFFGEDGQNFWWVAPIDKQADIAWRRLKQAIPKHLYTTNENYKRMDLLHNNTSIWFKSADNPDSLYGEDVYAAVIDEASRVKQDAWFAVRSTLTATRGPVRIIGNVKGKGNWAYKLGQKAREGAPNMEYHKITAYDAVEGGVLDAQEIEDAKAVYPDWMFRELYLAEAADDGGNPFGIDAIQSCIRVKEDGTEATKPLDTDPVAWGWDVAKAVNYTVGIGLDKDGNVCRFVRFKANWEITLNKIIRLTAGLPAMVDSTGVGDQLVERLRKDGGYNFRGFKFSTHTKQDLMVGLSVAIQNQEITYPADSRNCPLVGELELFEYEIRGDRVLYRAPDGYHDDCVDALALAVKLWKGNAAKLSGFTLGGGLSTGSYWK